MTPGPTSGLPSGGAGAYWPDRRDVDPAIGAAGAGAGDAEGSAASATLAARARFSRWDGSQGADLDASELLDALTDDLLASGDVNEALQRLIDRGWRSEDDAGPSLTGLQDLIDRLARERADVRARYHLDDVLGDVRQELDAIVTTERAGVAARLERSAAAGAPDPSMAAMLRDVAGARLDQLDGLPTDVGERIASLREYDFLEPEARRAFDALIERLGRQVLDQFVQGMGSAIRATTPDDLAANRSMVRDLNDLISERVAGRDPDVTEFLAKHGRFFPGARSFDEIIEQLAQRMGAMQSLMRSLSAEQRAELGSMIDALLRDDRLLADLARLSANLDRILPGGLGDAVRFRGGESLGLDGALRQIARLQAMERLEDALTDVQTPADLAALDRSAIGELLGPDALRDVETLDQIARQLEAAGYLARTGDRLELTARGSRRIGQGVLDALFARLRRDAFGSHRIDRGGRGGERTDSTKPYEFGDPFELDLRATMSNALRRPVDAAAAHNDSAAAGGRTGSATIKLRADDFEVVRTEQLSRTATVLLVDMSRSMLLRGCFLAAKKVAIALDTLIRTQYPHDHLRVIGFAYYAREIKPGSLAELRWDGDTYGTNLQHGLLLARRILARQAATNKEIVVITDGEPTAHFEAGQVEFSYPPTRRTISETLREVQRCTRDGITINTFMLERSRALGEFVDHMTRLNGGRAFHSTPERLGEFVLVDFVGRRSGRPS